MAIDVAGLGFYQNPGALGWSRDACRLRKVSRRKAAVLLPLRSRKQMLRLYHLDSGR